MVCTQHCSHPFNHSQLLCISKLVKTGLILTDTQLTTVYLYGRIYSNTTRYYSTQINLHQGNLRATIIKVYNIFYPNKDAQHTYLPEGTILLIDC